MGGMVLGASGVSLGGLSSLPGSAAAAGDITLGPLGRRVAFPCSRRGVLSAQPVSSASSAQCIDPPAREYLPESTTLPP